MIFAFIFLRILSWLPIRIIHAIAWLFATLAYPFAHRRRRIGEINLKRCLPELSDKQRKHILKANLYHMMCLLLEYGVCWYSKAERLQKLVHYQNKHYLDEVLAQGKTVIILYSHFCALEIATFRLNQDVPLTSIYATQSIKAMDKQILKGRHRYNNVFLVRSTDGIHSIIRSLKRHPEAPFLYLPDQDLGVKNSIFVPFFGIQTATTDALPRIAKLTKAVVVPAIPIREKNGHTTLHFYPAWKDFPSNDTVKDTAYMNAFIEQRVREYPEQYFWLHQRFKTRPQGEKSFYD